MELVQVKEYELDPEERASKRSGIGKDFDAKFWISMKVKMLFVCEISWHVCN